MTPLNFADFFTAKWLVLYVILASGLVVHFRGRVRLKLTRQLLGYETLLAPINVLMYAFSSAPNKPYLDVAQFPELGKLTAQWEMIREEALRLNEDGRIRASAGYNDAGFNSFFRTGWKRFYLKWYGDALPSAELRCPQTVALLKTVPSVTAAMFAVLPPGARLVSHRDPYAGSLRYHLGLYTPNSPECYIDVDGQRYFWRDGEAVMFDETFVHFAENKTDQTRVILFCDVERPLNNPFARAFNRFFRRTVMRAAQTQNEEGEHIGAINRVFGTVYQVRLAGKALKQKSRFAYYALKYALIAGLFYLIFF